MGTVGILYFCAYKLLWEGEKFRKYKALQLAYPFTASYRVTLMKHPVLLLLFNVRMNSLHR